MKVSPTQQRAPTSAATVVSAWTVSPGTSTKPAFPGTCARKRQAPMSHQMNAISMKYAKRLPALASVKPFFLASSPTQARRMNSLPSDESLPSSLETLFHREEFDFLCVVQCVPLMSVFIIIFVNYVHMSCRYLFPPKTLPFLVACSFLECMFSSDF